MTIDIHITLDDATHVPQGSLAGEATHVLMDLAQQLGIRAIGPMQSERFPILDPEGRRVGECVISRAEEGS